MAFPTGQSAAQAIARVRDKTNEASLPTDTKIVGFLNAGVEQVESELGGIFARQNIPVTPGQITVPLPQDIQEFTDMNYSIVLPTAAGATIYDITLLDVGNFMLAAAYQPANSGGQPVVAMVDTDSAGIITLQIFPSVSVAGFINIWYKQRPQIWDPANLSSTTTLDSAFQEAVILWACVDVCENRERPKSQQMFLGRFGDQLEKARTTIRKRTRPKVGQVRDVTSSLVGVPYWLGNRTY